MNGRKAKELRKASGFTHKQLKNVTYGIVTKGEFKAVEITWTYSPRWDNINRRFRTAEEVKNPMRRWPCRYFGDELRKAILV